MDGNLNILKCDMLNPVCVWGGGGSIVNEHRHTHVLDNNWIISGSGRDFRL